MRSFTRICVSVLLAAAALAAAWWYVHTTPRGDPAEAAAAVEGTALADSETSADPESDDDGRRPTRRDVASAEPPESAELSVTVRDDFGSPLAEARVFVLSASRRIQQARTDASGRACFVAEDGHGALFVARPTMVTQRVELDLAPGERTVSVPTLAVVAGAITVDGLPPSKPLRIQLVHERSPYAAFDVPLELRSLLELDAAFDCATGSSGEFRFSGLPHDWSGTLYFPRGYCVKRATRTWFGNRRVELPQPRTNLVYDLERLPHLVGHLVDERGAAVTVKHSVQVLIVQTSASTTLTSVETDESGHFEIALRDLDFRSVELEVTGTAGRETLHLERAEIGDDLDLGAITLRATHEVVFRALDGERRPVGDARGQIVGHAEWANADENGFGRTRGLSDRTARLRVLAPGFRAALVELVVPTSAVVEVTLRRANRLTLTLVDAEKRALSGLSIRIASKGTPLFADNGQWYPDDTMLGLLEGSSLGAGQDVGDTPSSASGWIEVGPGQVGRVVLQALSPGVALEVTAVDALQIDLQRWELAPLGEEEQRELELVVERALRSLVGRVRDESGVPLAGVRVSAAFGSSEAPIAISDDNGRFEIRGLAAEAVGVAARRAGFASTSIKLVALAQRETELDIVMRRGRLVSIEVRDERGRTVEGGQLSARLPPDGARFPAWSVEDGRFELRDVPRDELELTLELAGRRYQQRNFPAEEQAVFRVPVHGRLEVSVAGATEHAAAGLVLRLRPADPTLAEQERLVESDGKRVVSFAPLLPGGYELQLARLLHGLPAEPIGAVRRVRVEPDATAAVTLP